MAARHLSLHLLLFAAVITATNLHLLSAADTPPPPSTAPTPPSNPPPPSSPKPSSRSHRHHRHRKTPPLPPAPTSHTPPPAHSLQTPPPPLPPRTTTPSRASTPASNPPPKRRHRHSHHHHRKTPPLTPPPPTSHTPPPQPQARTPPPPVEIQENPLNPLRNIIDGLIGSSDFLGWNQGITSTDIPIAATFFVPDNNAILHPGGVDISPFLMLYHIVPQRLSFSQLQKLPVKARLPTMLPNKFILITNNSPSNFTVDDSPIVLPDVFSNAAFVLHGVGNILDFSVYGGDGIILPAAENATTSTSSSRRPLKKKPDYPREMTSGGQNYYPCNGILMVLLTLGYTLVSKIVFY